MSSIEELMSKLDISGDKTNLTMIEGPNQEKSYWFQDTAGDEAHKCVRKGLLKFINEIEIEEATNKYRRSPLSKRGLIEDVLRMNYPLDECKFTKNEHYQSALKLADEKFFPCRDCNFNPVHFCDLRRYDWNLSVSACEPWLSSDKTDKILNMYMEIGRINNKNKSFKNLYTPIFVDARKEIHKIKSNYEYHETKNNYIYDIRAFSRAHMYEVTGDPKVRFVYGCPKNHILAEAMYYWPLMDFMQQHRRNTPMLWGYESLLGGFNALVSEAPVYKFGTQILQLDWSKFDKRYSFDLWKDIHELIGSHHDMAWYVETMGYPMGKKPYKAEQDIRMKRLWDWVYLNYTNGPIRIPNGALLRRNYCGMASGIFGTQIVDSIGNFTILTALLSELNIKMTSNTFIKVMGDDSYIVLPRTEYTDEELIFAIKDLAWKRYRMELNDEKSKISDSFNGSQVLGYSYASGYPARPKDELISKLLYPERDPEDWSKIMSRCLGLAWAAAGQYPDFHKACNEIFDHLKSLNVKPSLGQYKKTMKFRIPENEIKDDLSTFPSIGLIRARVSSNPPSADRVNFMPTNWFKHTAMKWRLCRKNHRKFYPIEGYDERFEEQQKSYKFVKRVPPSEEHLDKEALLARHCL
uniref:RdRp n=1 Tax=viral metagenome TaxID=1070528 RepID=A0A8J9S3I3_9ZZZZ